MRAEGQLSWQRAQAIWDADWLYACICERAERVPFRACMPTCLLHAVFPAGRCLLFSKLQVIGGTTGARA
jgi:hypothetical protein